MGWCGVTGRGEARTPIRQISRPELRQQLGGFWKGRDLGRRPCSGLMRLADWWICAAHRLGTRGVRQSVQVGRAQTADERWWVCMEALKCGHPRLQSET